MLAEEHKIGSSATSLYALAAMRKSYNEKDRATDPIMNRRFLRFVASICTILMIYPLAFMAVAVVWSGKGLIYSDPAAPDLFAGVARLAYISSFMLASARFVKNLRCFRFLLGFAFIAGLCLLYSLLFQGDVNFGETGLGYFVAASYVVVLFVKMLVHRWMAILGGEDAVEE